MDSFTENLLSRARERQKLLQDYNEGKKSSPVKKVTTSQPNLTAPEGQLNHAEGNLSKNSPLHHSSDFTSHKTVNIQDEYFNMEIKLSSADNVRVEVQIEEQNDEENDSKKGIESGLRQDTRNRLDRLGKLYAGGDHADISSPIHQTEGKFHAEDSPKKIQNVKARRGLDKLADLAQRVNEFDDDLSSARKEKANNAPVKAKKSWKPPAPQPPPLQNTTNPAKVVKSKAPNLPSIDDNTTLERTQNETFNNELNECQKENKNLPWDRKVLDSLKFQGFTRSESNSKLVYKYGTKNEKTEEESKISTSSPQKQTRAAAIADKAALFESSPKKDPALLSVSERKALFEKNKGSALIPKAPFAMATPIKTARNGDKENATKMTMSSSPKKQGAGSFKCGGIAHKVASLFEAKSTISQEQIENNVKEQRKKEMDVLLNRFHKTEEIVEADEDTDYDDDATEETNMIVIEEKVVDIAPTKEERRSGGNKRCSKGDSPKVVAVLNDVKRIKVAPQKTGRLYPSLTDIESVTETENEAQNENSSTDNSIAESDDANTSFGRDILRTVCKNQTPLKRQVLEESASDMSDVLDDSDDYIDEALAYNAGYSNGPTPPKIGRKSPIESSHSFNYKSFQEDNAEFKSPPTRPDPPNHDKNLPTHVVDGENVLPLTHTVSFYRKQQSQQSTTPIRQISRQPLAEESVMADSDEQEQIRSKIIALKSEIAKQELIISQTSQALNLCNSTPEFMGSTEQVEAERVLLVSTHRRQAATHEKQRLEVENTLRPRRQSSGERFGLQKGDLTISKIILPLKQKYVTALAAAGGKGHHVVCLVKYAEQVLPTQLVSTVVSNRKNPELELTVPGSITIKEIDSDFTVTFEVYCLQAQEEILPHEVKYHIKKPSAKLTPKKYRLVYPVRESPGGPQVVRSPTFALMGYVLFSLQTIKKKQWTLINTPSMSPLEGTVHMCIHCQLQVSVEHRGFLTMFEDVSGFGAWHRRWCLLNGDTLSYWKYPDDEKTSLPINSISLRDSITKQVGPVSREICARLHTFLLETEREGRPQDKDSLVTIRKGSRTVIRHLLSADTKEERIEWCNKFNAVLSDLAVWSRN